MSSNKAQRIYRASGDGWECWNFQDGAPKDETPQKFPVLPVPAARSVVALPARWVNILPLWLNSGDPALLPGMAAFQMAASGLSRNAAAATRTIASADGRSLVASLSFPSDPPEALCNPGVAEFFASPELEQMPPDSAVIWEEEGHRVIAVTRGDSLVYWESRCRPDEASLLTDLSCLFVRLSADGMIDSLKSIVLRIPAPVEITESLSCRFNVTVTVEQRPPPRLPGKMAARLIPEPVSQKRAAIRRRKAAVRVVTLVLVLFLGAAGVMLGRQQLLAGENARMARALDAEAAAVAQVSAAQARWAALRPALDPDLYPVERLLQAVLLMPTDGLRLTIFEQSIEEGSIRVIIIGEASSPQAAFAFSEAVRTHPSWSMFQWQIPQPTILPNNTARFRMEGSFPYATSL